jgi:hypothetical protein
MAKIILDNAQKVDITAKRRDDFVLNLNIYDSNGSPVVFSSADVLVFSITDNDYNPIVIACNKTLNINESTPEWVQDDKINARGVARNLAIYAGGNTGIETRNYGTSDGTPQSEIETSIFFNDFSNDLNNYAAVGVIPTTENPVQIVIDNNYFDLPPGSYKYTFKSLSDLRGVQHVFRDATTWLYGKIKINE